MRVQIQRVLILASIFVCGCLFSQDARCSSLATPVLTASSSAYTYPSSIAFTVSLRLDGFVPITVQILNGTTVLYSTNNTNYTSAAYTYTWVNPLPGTYSLTAKAFYSAGSKVSAPITVTINVPNPTVTLTSPANNASCLSPAVISLAATALAGYGSISKVEFYNGTTLIATTTSSPYTYAWSNVGGGCYAVMAKVYNSSGKVATSVVSNVSVYANPQFISFDSQCATNIKK